MSDAGPPTWARASAVPSTNPRSRALGNRGLPNLHELEPLLPIHHEAVDCRRRRPRLVEPPRRLALRDVEKLVVPYEVDHAKRRHAGLPRPEEVPRSAKPQIAFGDLEAV